MPLASDEEALDRPTGGVPGLDGMRALFVLGVIAFHLWADAHDWRIDPGSIGVVGFFAHSGYLITGLLIREHDVSGAVHMWNFYARRALRLLPALILLLAVWLLVDLLFPMASFSPPCPAPTRRGARFPS